MTDDKLGEDQGNGCEERWRLMQCFSEKWGDWGSESDNVLQPQYIYTCHHPTRMLHSVAFSYSADESLRGQNVLNKHYSCYVTMLESWRTRPSVLYIALSVYKYTQCTHTHYVNDYTAQVVYSTLAWDHLTENVKGAEGQWHPFPVLSNWQSHNSIIE